MPHKEAAQSAVTAELELGRLKEETADSRQLSRAIERKDAKKLSADLRDLVAMLKDKGEVKDYEHDRVRVKDGKITLQVQLASASDKILKKLENAGMKILFTSSTAKLVIGTIAVDRLKALEDVPEVLLVEPARTG